MMIPEKCFYVPGERHIQDGAILKSGEYIGQFSGENLNTMLTRVPGVQLYDFEHACAESDAAKVAYYCNPPVEITKEKYWEMLECLPPCKWTYHRGAETFHVSERLDGDIVCWCVKIAEKYWALNRSSSRSPASIIEECAPK